MTATPRFGRPSTLRYSVWGATFLLGLVLAAFSLFHSVLAQDSKTPPQALVLTIDGAIGPATMDYVVRGIERAENENASLVIIRMDTPGGLMDSMRAIIQRILSSSVPVVTYVSPEGARAASAGTYILYGSHVAAMAPATHLGSATPVQMGGLPGSDAPEEDAENGSGENSSEGNSDEENGGDEPRRGGSAMERKVLEDAVSYIRGLAERHGRNADWAEEAVREAVNLGATEALEQNVIEIVAGSMPDLLEQLDGRTVSMSSGEQILATADMELVRADPDWRTQLLSVITNPNVAYFLMIIGFYGLIFELANPGSLVPGVLGAICLVLALFAFQVLSVNYAGLALVLLGLAFIVGEAFMPSFGILGIGGVVAFVVGSIILMDGTNQRISLPVVGGTAAVMAGFMLWTVTRFMGLRKRKPVSGLDAAEQEPAFALDTFTAGAGQYRGHVRLEGERWNAVSQAPVQEGQTLAVQEFHGLTVVVRPVSGDSGTTPDTAAHH